MSKVAKKAVVYIDGENFIHRVIDLLGPRNKAGRQGLINIDIAQLLKQVTKYSGTLEIRFYTTKIKMSGTTEEIRSKLEKIVEFNSRFMPSLRTQNIMVIRAGILRPRMGNPCASCGYTIEFLTEKGVDVRLAVDMVVDSRDVNIDRMYILSSDLDLLPAIQEVKKMKKKMVYVTSADAVIGALVAVMSETLTFSKEQERAVLK